MTTPRLGTLNKALMIAYFALLYLAFIEPNRAGHQWKAWTIWLPVVMLAFFQTRTALAARDRVEQLRANHPALPDDVAGVLTWHSKWAVGNAVTLIAMCAALNILWLVTR